MIAHWKGIVEEINFGGSIMPSNIIEKIYPKKPSFRLSKWSQKLKTAKNSKLPKLPENYFELVGKGGWPIDVVHQGRTLLSSSFCSYFTIMSLSF
jgi:hypothetical protein